MYTIMSMSKRTDLFFDIFLYFIYTDFGLAHSTLMNHSMTVVIMEIIFQNNNNIFNKINDKQVINYNTFYNYFKIFINKNNQNIKRFTKKHVKNLYEIQTNNFLNDIIHMLNNNNISNNNNNNNMDMDDDKKYENENENGMNIFNIDSTLMGCIESSFASIVAARYSLLKSIYITFLYISIELEIDINGNEIRKLNNLLNGYFILSYLSSTVYEPKQYLCINNYNNYNISESLKQNQSISMIKRYELLNNLQSSFKCGLSIRYYIRYKQIINNVNDNEYFKSIIRIY